MYILHVAPIPVVTLSKHRFPHAGSDLKNIFHMFSVLLHKKLTHSIKTENANKLEPILHEAKWTLCFCINEINHYIQTQ
jgi:hypothetical protein